MEQRKSGSQELYSYLIAEKTEYLLKEDREKICNYIGNRYKGQRYYGVTFSERSALNLKLATDAIKNSIPNLINDASEFAYTKFADTKYGELDVSYKKETKDFDIYVCIKCIKDRNKIKVKRFYRIDHIGDIDIRTFYNIKDLVYFLDRDSSKPISQTISYYLRFYIRQLLKG